MRPLSPLRTNGAGRGPQGDEDDAGQAGAGRRARERFKNEIRIAQRLAHPNILRVFDYGEDGRQMFFTMEYVDGTNLREWMEEKQAQGDIPLPEAAALTIEILDGLAWAHQETVHRDIKPENLLMSGNGRIKICDFGLAQLLSRGALLSSSQILGTYNYMAPEQQLGSQVDRRADLYTVVVFYEMLTGRFPVGRFKLPTRLRSDLVPEVDEVVEKALEPDDRYQDAAEMQTLAITYVRASDSTLGVLRRLNSRLNLLGIRPELYLLDRGYYSVEVIAWLIRYDKPFIMPMIARGKKSTADRPATGSYRLKESKVSRWDRYTMKSPEHGEVTFDAAICCTNYNGRHDKKGRRTFIYATYGVSHHSLSWVSEIYRIGVTPIFLILAQIV